jgi:hypothetical protein
MLMLRRQSVATVVESAGRLAGLLLLAGSYALFGWACSSGGGKKDQYYGTDAAATYEPKDASTKLDAAGDAAAADTAATDTAVADTTAADTTVADTMAADTVSADTAGDVSSDSSADSGSD